jgi:hypothetical protein
MIYHRFAVKSDRYLGYHLERTAVGKSAARYGGDTATAMRNTK